MGTGPRLTHQSLKVLSVFVEDPAGEFCGSTLMRLTGLAAGTLYPIVLRFEKFGLLQSHWEGVDPREVGRPRRRLYSITLEGERMGRRALSELQVGFLKPLSIEG